MAPCPVPVDPRPQPAVVPFKHLCGIPNPHDHRPLQRPRGRAALEEILGRPQGFATENLAAPGTPATAPAGTGGLAPDATSHPPDWAPPGTGGPAPRPADDLGRPK